MPPPAPTTPRRVPESLQPAEKRSRGEDVEDDTDILMLSRKPELSLEFRPRADPAGAGCEAPVTVMLVGAKRAAQELRFAELSVKDQALMKQAMAKEWSKWSEFGATRAVPLPSLNTWKAKGACVVGTRWVLVRKTDGP